MRYGNYRISLLLAWALVIVSSGCDAPPSDARPKWNVLVVVPDTVRADHLRVNGYERETTPHLDALAAEGTNFSQAITVAPRTWQSFCSILTGLYPPNHGVRFILDHPLRADTPTLATALSRGGWATAAFDQLPFLRGMTGEVGFAEYHEQPFEKALIDVAWQWISAERTRPFFAFVRLNGAHWPYRAPAEEVTKFDPCDGQDHAFNHGNFADSGLRVGGEGVGILLAEKEAYWNRHYKLDASEAANAHRIAHYDAQLRSVDALIGKLFDRMRSTGLLERTVVVVTSDHGESFGEGGYLMHGPQLDEPVVRVPLIIRLPEGAVPSGWAATILRGLGLKRPLRGRPIDHLVRVTDIFPTVLASVGLPIPENLDGINLLPAMTGAASPELWAYAESGRSFVDGDPDRYVEGVGGKMRMVREQDWKLIFVPKPDGGEYRLFDLREDPGEERNVAEEYPDKLEALRLRLRPLLLPANGETERVLTEAEKEQLRQLGYL